METAALVLAARPQRLRYNSGQWIVDPATAHSAQVPMMVSPELAQALTGLLRSGLIGVVEPGGRSETKVPVLTRLGSERLVESIGLELAEIIALECIRAQLHVNLRAATRTGRPR